MQIEQNQPNTFFINFSIPDIVTPKDTFSCNKELSNEWREIGERVFPQDLENDFEKDKFLNLSIDEVNWDGENFQFKIEQTNFDDEEKKIVAYMLARAVQKEHSLPEKKINIDIVSKNETTSLFF